MVQKAAPPTPFEYTRAPCLGKYPHVINLAKIKGTKEEIESFVMHAYEQNLQVIYITRLHLTRANIEPRIFNAAVRRYNDQIQKIPHEILRIPVDPKTGMACVEAPSWIIELNEDGHMFMSNERWDALGDFYKLAWEKGDIKGKPRTSNKLRIKDYCLLAGINVESTQLDWPPALVRSDLEVAQ